MPYIRQEDRKRLERGEPALIAGELNYQIFYRVKHDKEEQEQFGSRYLIKDIEGFVEQFLGGKPNYQKYNDMTGALVRCAKEIKRRLHLELPFLYQILESYDEEIAKYEDVKIKENGDVE